MPRPPYTHHTPKATPTSHSEYTQSHAHTTLRIHPRPRPHYAHNTPKATPTLRSEYTQSHAHTTLTLHPKPRPHYNTTLTLHPKPRPHYALNTTQGHAHTTLTLHPKLRPHLTHHTPKPRPLIPPYTQATPTQFTILRSHAHTTVLPPCVVDGLSRNPL